MVLTVIVCQIAQQIIKCQKFRFFFLQKALSLLFNLLQQFQFKFIFSVFYFRFGNKMPYFKKMPKCGNLPGLCES
jgi:hypothetical protein